MSALTAVVYVGAQPPIGGGLQPAVVAHLYEGGLPRFVAYEVTEREGAPPAMDAVGGAYAPEFEAGDDAHPITDLLLATHRDGSAIAQRLDVLSEKARANYGRDFREMVFTSTVEWGSDGYGRLFEARSQLEAHPFESAVTVAFHPGVGEDVRVAITANLERIDGPTAQFGAGESDQQER
jgi:hypothetical protein